MDTPYAREAGFVEAAAGVVMPAGEMAGHDVPRDVLNSVAHWVQRGAQNAAYTLGVFRRNALEGSKYCFNEGCEVVGHLKDFKVCPQCKTARYCRERVSAARLDGGWAQGDMWHNETMGRNRNPKPQLGPHIICDSTLAHFHETARSQWHIHKL